MIQTVRLNGGQLWSKHGKIRYRAPAKVDGKTIAAIDTLNEPYEDCVRRAEGKLGAECASDSERINYRHPTTQSEEVQTRPSW